MMADAGTRPLRVRQAADLLGVSPATVRRWARQRSSGQQAHAKRRTPLPPRRPRGALGGDHAAVVAAGRRGATLSAAPGDECRAGVLPRPRRGTAVGRPPTRFRARHPRLRLLPARRRRQAGLRRFQHQGLLRRRLDGSRVLPGGLAFRAPRDRAAPRGRPRQRRRPPSDRGRTRLGALLWPAQLHRPSADRRRQGDRHDRAARPHRAAVHGGGDRRRRGGGPARRPRHRAGEAVRRGQTAARRQPARLELGAQRQGLLHARSRQPRRRRTRPCWGASWGGTTSA